MIADNKMLSLKETLNRPEPFANVITKTWAETCAEVSAEKNHSENNCLECFLVEGVGFEPT